MSDHALFSPSGAHRWMACPGSIALEEGTPGKSSIYADAGTAAHEVASMALLSGTTAHAYVGRIIRKEGMEHDITVTEEMAEHVQRYIDSVREYTRGGELLVEQSVDFGDAIRVPDQRGTSDAIGILVKARELQTHDLKYGMQPVAADNNAQLMLYMLGVIHSVLPLLGHSAADFDTFRLVIHQPRVREDPAEWVCTPEELRAFADKAAECAEKALYARLVAEGLRDGEIESYLVPGEKQCFFCKARHTCPKRNGDILKDVLGDFENLEAASPRPVVADSDEAFERAVVLYQKLGMIRDWCKDLAQAVEVPILTGQRKHPALKIVRGKGGNRVWSDEAGAVALLRDLGLSDADIYEKPKLASPAVIDKTVKGLPNDLFDAEAKKEVLTEKLPALVRRPEGKLSVAPASDPRPAASPDAEVVTDFEELPD